MSSNSSTTLPYQTIINIGLPLFTIAAVALTSLKMPEWGLLINLIAQVFWLYSSYYAWKKANQWGILVSTIVITFIVLGGVVNYWFL